MSGNITTSSFTLILILPSLFTLVVVLGSLIVTRWRRIILSNYSIAGFVLLLLTLNFIELITYANLVENLYLMGKIYYSVVIVILALFVCLCERPYNLEAGKKYMLYASLVISSIVLVSLITGTDLVLAGIEPIAYSVTRIPGKFYWLFEVYLIACITGGSYIIYLSIDKAANPLDKKRHKVILYSLLPFALTCLLVVVFIQFEINIKIPILIPICTLIFILVYIQSENQHGLFRLLVHIPYSKEREAYLELNKKLIDYISKTQTDEQLSLKSLMMEIETSLIASALDTKDGNYNLAAELLSISPSTVYRHKKPGEREKS